MRILLVTDSYPPEIRSASHLMEELAQGLVERGYEILVVTTFPQYNLSKENMNRSFDSVQVENGVQVIRVKTLPHHNVNFIMRGLAQLTMPYIIESKIKKYLKDIDLVLVYSPPLPLALLGRAIKKKCNAKFFLNIQDIFPQNAIDLGVLKSSLLIRFFKHLEQLSYRSADRILVHSEGNLSFLQTHHPDLKHKLSVLHNWIDTKQFNGVTRTNKYRNLYGLHGKFIVLFAGVMGPSQGLDFVLRVAQSVQDLDDIVFLMVGDGMHRSRLEQLAHDMRLKNVIFKPFVSKQEYVFLVKDCDLGLVSLTSMNKTPVVPGKILGYMAASLPVIAFLNEESDGHWIIQQSQSGRSCKHGDLERAVNLVRELHADIAGLEKMGQSGYKYVSDHFDRDICLSTLIKFMEENS